MGSKQKQPRPERGRTDQSLSAERTKSDNVLRKKRELVEAGADAVVEQARTRANDVIDVARRRADDQPGPAAPSAPPPTQVLRARAKEDQALQQEHKIADDQLEGERRGQASHDWLSVERESTDRHLTTERTRSDEVLASRDDFLGMVSHDLRTMLGGIALHADMLTRPSTADEPGQRVLAHAHKIQRFTARMNRLIGDLLDVSSIEAGRLKIETRRGDAAGLAREAAEVFQAQASAQGIALEVAVAKDSMMARFDHERILQVFANLLTNALRFTPEGGKIALRVEPEADHVLLCVADTGSGIPEDKLEAIFARFGQIAEGDRRGVGLGLFISKSIIEAHGGKIWAESRPGEGSTFLFTLPAAGDG